MRRHVVLNPGQDVPGAGTPLSSPDGRATRWWLRLVLPLLLCGPAFVVGLDATRGLAWPPDTDLYRDIAQAQTMADGALLADPFYRDETLWYNPLVPGLVAALAGLSGQPDSAHGASEASRQASPLGWWSRSWFRPVATVTSPCHSRQHA
jgi:hypothetical protein